MAIAKTYISYELGNGVVHDDQRILWVDRAAAERTMHNRKWLPIEAHNAKLTALLAWFVSKRLGHHDLAFEDFEAELVDVEVEKEEADEDPTQAG